MIHTGNTWRQKTWGQGMELHHVRNFIAEARAAKKIIQRSGLCAGSLERICGVRMIHTGNTWRQKDDGQKNDDEKERMISALKTAVGFFFVPLLLLFVFGGGAGGGGGRSESMAGLDRAQRPGQPIGEIQWNDFYQNLLLKGEVQEIIIHSGVNRATAVLYPGAVYQGRPLAGNTVRLVTPKVNNIEARIREAEQQMGIKAGQGVSITYERRSESMGQVLGLV